MHVRTRSLEFLDWPVVTARLSDYAGSSRGRTACATLEPFEDIDQARDALTLTGEMARLLDEADPPGMGFPEIEKLVDGAIKGAVLSPEELGDVAAVAEVATAARRFYTANAELAPALAARAADLTPMADLASSIRTCFDGEGRIRDHVSGELARLRRDRERLSTEIRAEMDRIKKDDAWGKILQDDYVTIRGDRFVLPIKASAKNMDLGIVHDTSRSGETVFIEPTELVHRNNQLKITEVQLQRETRRILAELAGDVAERADALRRNVEIATELDVVLAKARFARVLEATAPTLVDEPVIALPAVRHPLLILKRMGKQQEEVVIANDVFIDADVRSLVITGPNAGGKTVLLKSIALCALMIRCGMHVPTADGARLGFFAPVLADIGDQQTVLGDLSTFSAHLQNLSRILDALSDRGVPLILLDELFVGTNPDQGAGLARATLEHIVEHTQSRILVTTHYDALKALAATDERFRNAAMEFDAEHLRPTFRLADGMPGRSYAYDIAQRFGVPESILERARDLTRDASRGLEDVIAGLEAREAEMAQANKKLEAARLELDRKTAERDAATRELNETIRKLREEHLEEARELIEGARDEIRKLVAEAQRTGGAKAADTARRQLEEKAEALTTALEPDVAEVEEPTGEVDVSVGAAVFVPTLGRDGTVTAINDRGRAEVAVGSFTVEITMDELQPPRRKAPSKPQRRKAPEPPTPTPAPEIDDGGIEYSRPTSTNTCDLRGMRVDEALAEVERYLDRAALDGRTPIFLIHGHGTGALKRSVREYVSGSAYVQRWRPGEGDQGGDGVTVVDLA